MQPNINFQHRLFLLPFLFFLMTFPLEGFTQEEQKGHTISGEVKEEDGTPIPYASVSLMDPSDSSQVDGIATNEKGKFEITAPDGNYYLVVQFLSYQKKKISDIKVSGEKLKLGTINLKPNSETLNEVEIKDEKRRMEIKLDKKVFNVDKSLNNAGGNASEVLDNTPSVSVDMDGNVSLRGSQAVRILINGKPSGMVSNGNTDALRNLQASMIEKIEVITNPSARYDAEGEAGVINIVLKDEQKGGFNGGFNVTTGYPHDHGGGFNLNYRKGLFNVFGSYGFNYDNRPGYGSSIQKFDTGDSTYTFERDREHARGGTSHNARLGADLIFNEYNTLTLSSNFNFGDERNPSTVTYRDLDQEGQVTKTTIREQLEKEIDQNIEGDLRYERSFEEKDRKWVTDVKYVLDKDHETADIEETIKEEGDQFQQRSDNIEDEENLILQSDYVHPFGNEGRFETGLKSTNRFINNDYVVEQKHNGKWTALSNFNDEFVYTERVHAAYVMAGEKFGDFSLQGGLRSEYTLIETELIEAAKQNTQEYYNLFPSAHISYEMAKENSIQVSYSRRINRPHFWDLIPFFGYSDPRRYRSGNPELRPEFTDSYELGHVKYWDKGSLMSSLYYRHRTDVEEDITLVDSAGYTRSFPVNMATQDAFGIEFNGTYRFTPNWDINADINLYRAITEGSYQERDLYSDTYTMRGRLTSQAKLEKGWELQGTFSYRAPRKTTQGRRLASWSLDLGIAKKIFNEKGKLTLQGRDIFNTRIHRKIVDTEGYYEESEFQWRSRQIRLTFSYQLKSGDKGSGKRR